MKSYPSNKKLKPEPKTEPIKLILPAIFLACIPAITMPLTVIFPSFRPYLVYFLPFGFVAAILARIALGQIKRGFGTPQQRKLAIITYFLGLLPALIFFGVLTFELFSL